MAYVVLSRSVLQRRYYVVANAIRYYSNRKDYDVIVAGGGMVGGTMACALKKSPILSKLNILLLEGSEKKTFKLGETYSNRVSALNQNTRSLMEKIGAWNGIASTRMQPVRDMHVWDACSDAFITFNEENTETEIAYMVENDILLHSVFDQLGDADVLYGSAVTSVSLPEGGGNVAVTLKNGDELHCKLLIGADGANSKVRAAMRVQYLSWPYNQMGVVATLKLAGVTGNDIAWQRFVPTGPIALLPLDDHHSSLVWSLPTEMAKNISKMSDDEFVDALNDALWKKHPQSGVVSTAMSAVSTVFKTSSAKQFPPSVAEVVAGTRAAFPLGFGHSTKYIADGVALVGDAAHRVHPLAGQGVNLGFGDVATLIEILEKAVYSGESIADYANLARYETLRQRYNVPMQFSVDALHRLYTTDAMPVVLARSVGLQIVNSLLPLKKAFMDHARN